MKLLTHFIWTKPAYLRGADFSMVQCGQSARIGLDYSQDLGQERFMR